MLAHLGGFPLVEWVIRRVQRAKFSDLVVLATSASSYDDSLANVAGRMGVRCFRGSESDVLLRIRDAAVSFGAENVVRVCADNPFVDPVEIDRLIATFHEHKCDYAFNHLDRLGSQYADGFGAEILSTQLLNDICKLTSKNDHREHVTQYIWDFSAQFNICAVKAPSDLSFPNLKFDVDYPIDLLKLERLIENGVTLDTPAPEIIIIQQRLD